MAGSARIDDGKSVGNQVEGCYFVCNIFPALGNRNLISIEQLCDHGFSAIFISKYVSLIGLNNTAENGWVLNIRKMLQTQQHPSS